MAAPFVCPKCGASLPAGSGLKCSCRRWRVAHEWFILVATLIAGIAAFINS